MALKVSDKYLSGFIAENEYKECALAASKAFSMVKEKNGIGNDFLGWVDLPENYDRGELVRIKAAAERIKKSCDVLVVIGIGGSYLGASAAIEFLRSPRYNSIKKDTPDIYFAGCDISAASMKELLEICEGRDVCINVISKSGTTIEPAIAFRVFRELLEKKCGKKGARERIFVTTDNARGTLKEFSDKAGYETFVVPDDVGGRFSVLTAVGLLPIAAAGVDVDELIRGAADAREKYLLNGTEDNDAYKYAVIRNILYGKGKTVEILVSYEAYAKTLSEWWKQLYGESEGKDNKGIFPASVVFSTDLHSLGQYIQEGRRDLFETVISIGDSKASFNIPYDENNVDGLNFIAGVDLDEVKKSAMQGTLLAHVDGGVPNVVIEVKDRSAYSLGYLFYFFEIACAISGYMLGVNPFNQPGVEAYKKNMFALLGKPGYEEMRAALEEKLS